MPRFRDVPARVCATCLVTWGLAMTIALARSIRHETELPENAESRANPALDSI